MSYIKTKVIILGGGLAGLSAGFYLKKNNIDFIILEVRDRLGGRVWTKKLKEENLHLELGGEWIRKNHKNIINLCKFFNLKLIDHSFNTSIYINNEFKKEDNWNFDHK